MNYYLCFAILTIEILICSGCKEREEQTRTRREITASQAKVIALRVASQNVPNGSDWKFEVEDTQWQEEGWLVYLIDVNNLDALGCHCAVLVRDDGSTVIYPGE